MVVDLVTMPSDALLRTREAIASMARTELEPGTRLMLVALERGLRVAQPFTDDVERFVAAVETLTPTAADGEASLVELIDQVDSACEPDLPGALQNAINAGQVFIDNARRSMSTALGGMAAVSRHLATLPGRKHLVYYSAGYPMDPADVAILVIQSICQGRSSATSLGATRSDVQAALRGGSAVDSIGLLQALVDEANRAQVSVYTVDARGLMGDVPPARSRTPARLARSGAAQEAQRRAVRAPQEILRSIADGTGGTASINTNDLARGMQAAAKDARGYYLLAYGPPAGRKEGRYYPIEVKVARPGLHLRYRRGYEWLSEAKRAERAMAGALGFPGLYGEDGLGLDPWVEAGKLHVAVILPTRTLSFRSEGGVHRNEIAIQALLRDERGQPVGERFLFTKAIDLKLPEDRLADLALARQRGDRERGARAEEGPLPGRGGRPPQRRAPRLRHRRGRRALTRPRPRGPYNPPVPRRRSRTPSFPSRASPPPRWSSCAPRRRPSTPRRRSSGRSAWGPGSRSPPSTSSPRTTSSSVPRPPRSWASTGSRGASPASRSTTRAASPS